MGDGADGALFGGVEERGGGGEGRASGDGEGECEGGEVLWEVWVCCEGGFGGWGDVDGEGDGLELFQVCVCVCVVW